MNVGLLSLEPGAHQLEIFSISTLRKLPREIFMKKSYILLTLAALLSTAGVADANTYQLRLHSKGLKSSTSTPPLIVPQVRGVITATVPNKYTLTGKYSQGYHVIEFANVKNTGTTSLDVNIASSGNLRLGYFTAKLGYVLVELNAHTVLTLEPGETATLGSAGFWGYPPYIGRTVYTVNVPNASETFDITYNLD